MRQDAVATRFGVSQNTAREAFRLLEAEGFLRSEPRRGVSVVPLAVAEVEEISQLRVLLEVQALAWAMPRFEPLGLDDAACVLDQLDGAKSVDAVLALNAAFHRLLYAPGGAGPNAGADRNAAVEISSVTCAWPGSKRIIWRNPSASTGPSCRRAGLAMPRRPRRCCGAHIGETGRQVAACLRRP